ncbi:MAG: hypothetical protein JW715_01715 [Sedimentisphaerales bacterium]|nr:hypothetical protein [Sedimentisphaerales bacterium]
MISKKYKIRKCAGATLVSILITTALILIALIGTSNFRYYAGLDARKAAAQTSAARIALMLCENWRGIKGDTGYDPVAYFSSDMTLIQNEGPDKPDDFTLLGSYKIILDEDEDDTDGADYYASLSWKDVQPGLRALNVVVAWSQRGQDGIKNTDKTYSLTTYVMTL